MPTEREQKLIDICFQIGITIHHHNSLKVMSKEKLTGWIAEQLKECGFPTKPVGMSWGVLQDDD